MSGSVFFLEVDVFRPFPVFAWTGFFLVLLPRAGRVTFVPHYFFPAVQCWRRMQLALSPPFVEDCVEPGFPRGLHQMTDLPTMSER